MDRKSIEKILVKEKPAQGAAQVCVHYYFLTFCSAQVAPTKNPPPQRWVRTTEQREGERERYPNRSELEGGLDQTAHGIESVVAALGVGERLAQVVQSRGDGDVVGDLELVEEFPGEATTG